MDKISQNVPIQWPMVSIIVAVFNGAKTLQRCIDSITSQTYSNIELIIIDGVSTDGTVDIIQKNEAHVSYWESSSDTGIYHAWNKALKHMNGEWVCFLGADDYFWHDNVLEEISGQLCDAYPDFRVVYGQVALVNEKNEVLSYAGAPWENVKKKFQSLMSLPHQGVMHHHSLFNERGIFDETFKIAGDYELLLRELNSHDALFVPDIILTAMQHGGVSADPSNSLHMLEEFRQAHKKLLGSGSGWRWWLAYFKVRIRMFMWAFLGEKFTRILLDWLRMCIGKSKHWTRI